MALRSLWEYRALSIVFMSRQLAVGVGNVRTASRSPQPAELPRSFSASLATGVGHRFRPAGGTSSQLSNSRRSPPATSSTACASPIDDWWPGIVNALRELRLLPVLGFGAFGVGGQQLLSLVVVEEG